MYGSKMLIAQNEQSSGAKMQNTKSYFNARPFDKMDSTTACSREFYPKTIYSFLYLGQGSCAKGTKDAGAICKTTPLKIMPTHMDR